jgi:hypothetical protein
VVRLVCHGRLLLLIFGFGAAPAERDADGVAVLVAHAVDGVEIDVFGAATPIAFEFVCLLTGIEI